jgi:hypothetical protein
VTSAFLLGASSRGARPAVCRCTASGPQSRPAGGRAVRAIRCCVSLHSRDTPPGQPQWKRQSRCTSSPRSMDSPTARLSASARAARSPRPAARPSCP